MSPGRNRVMIAIMGFNAVLGGQIEVEGLICEVI